MFTVTYYLFTVSKNIHNRILQTLQEQRAERKKIADKGYSIERQGDSVEENELNKLWKDQSQKLMLFACEHGTVDVVQYFVTELVSPKFGYVNS